MDGMDGRHGHERGGWCSSPSGFFWVLLVFFWCSSGVLLVFDNTEEHQKNPEEPRRTPEEKPPPAAGEWEGEEHQPPLSWQVLGECFFNGRGEAGRAHGHGTSDMGDALYL